MAGPWLVDGNRFASKIKSASGTSDRGGIQWNSNPSKTCPNCNHVIDNSDVVQEWPGLPRGVKFDPSDQEIIWHLLAKAGVGDIKCHPFIEEFIPTVDKDDGICYTHPQNLPGVKQDGTISHFFHRAIKAYNTGTRKRRKIQGDDSGDVRWHKTGKTKPMILDGVQKGCKKIMVLYTNSVRGGKSEKTNWVMHQYHLGTGEDEKDGEYVISKIFYQQQQVNKGAKLEEDVLSENTDVTIVKIDPVTPKSVIPDAPRTESRSLDADLGEEAINICIDANTEVDSIEELHPESNDNYPKLEDLGDEVIENNDNAEEDPKWWEGESQNLLDSQQLVEGLSLCDELLQSQSPSRDGNSTERANGKPRLSDYAELGSEDLKKDLVACQELVVDPANIDLDTPPDFRLSQLDFCSQESFLSWGVRKGAE